MAMSPPSRAQVEAAVASLDAALAKGKPPGLDISLELPGFPRYIEWVTCKLFLQLADARTEDGQRALSLARNQQLAGMICEQLSLPPWLFSDVAQQFSFYDFNGDGVLDRSECIKMYKKIARQRRRELGGWEHDTDVPWSSLAEEGLCVERELGRGGQGAMYLCTRKGSCGLSRRPLCVKFFAKSDPNAGSVAELIEEFLVMKEMNEKHIARTYKYFQDAAFFYLVNEPYFGGDLTKLGKRAHDAGIEMSEAWWRPILKGCLDGLAYLHRKGIIHCDIKEPNIMIAQDNYAAPTPVLIDFGLSKGFSVSQSGIGGTPGYIPPEVWRDGFWRPRGDLFSLGITFFQILSGLIPSADGRIRGVLQRGGPKIDFAAYREDAFRKPLPWQYFPESMRGGSDSLEALLLDLTNRELFSRPRAPVALQHAWFSSHSDAALPKPVLNRLLTSGAQSLARHAAVKALVAGNGEASLSRLQAKLRGWDPHGIGLVPANVLVQLMVESGVEEAVAAEYARVTAQGGLCEYQVCVEEARWEVKQYVEQMANSAFDELDTDEDEVVEWHEMRTYLKKGAAVATAGDSEDEEFEGDTAKAGGACNRELFLDRFRRENIRRMIHRRRAQRGAQTCELSCSIS